MRTYRLTPSYPETYTGMATTSFQSIFNRLPFELVNPIFTMAAQNHDMAAKLCRVSSETLSYVVPILYHTIIINSETELERFQVALSHYERRLLYLNAIRNLYLAPRLILYPHHEFPKVKLAMVPLYKPSFRLGLLMPYFDNLTHLCLHTAMDGKFIASIPLSTVTHLFIAGKHDCLTPQSTFIPMERLPNLTHFVTYFVRGHSTVDQDTLGGFFEWLGSFPKLSVIGISPITEDYSWDDPTEAISHAWVSDPSISLRSLSLVLGCCLHPGVVVLNFDFQASDWKKWAQGEPNIWQIAENALRNEGTLMFCAHPGA